jgi:hypothetical protein
MDAGSWSGETGNAVGHDRQTEWAKRDGSPLAPMTMAAT